jgi:hypothetical protein
MATKRSPKQKIQERAVPMEWDFPEDVGSAYATNMLVQATEQEFFVSFFETRPPVILKPEDIETIKSLRAECVARIIISPDRMAEFVKVLKQQLDNFNARKKSKGRSNGAAK